MEEMLKSVNSVYRAQTCILRRNQKPQAGISEKSGGRRYSPRRRDLLAVTFVVYFCQ